MAESVATALLVSVIVGSGIVADPPGGAPLALLQHAVAVAAALAALIAVTQPVSGAHLNPLITVVAWRARELDGRTASLTIGAQVAGAILGALVTGATFGRATVGFAAMERGGIGVLAGETIATFGLVLLIVGLVRAGRATTIPAAAGAWVGAAILATASTGFANPAVTVARTLTESATGIAPSSVGAFLTAQALGLGLALLVVRLLFPAGPARPDLATLRPDPTGP